MNNEETFPRDVPVGEEETWERHYGGDDAEDSERGESVELTDVHEHQDHLIHEHHDHGHGHGGDGLDDPLDEAAPLVMGRQNGECTINMPQGSSDINDATLTIPTHQLRRTVQAAAGVGCLCGICWTYIVLFLFGLLATSAITPADEGSTEIEP